jgi:hypothetical protein
MWMACHTQEAIAKVVGVARETVRDFLQKMAEDFQGKESAIFRDFEELEDSPRRIYSVWNFPKSTNEAKHFGNIPPEIVDNLLFYYTQPFDVVFDPFGGGRVKNPRRAASHAARREPVRQRPHAAHPRGYDPTARRP